MRILMIAPEGFFCPQGTPLSVYYRIRELEAIGHSVDLLTYPAGAAPPPMAARVFRSGPRFVEHVRPGPSWTKLLCDSLLIFDLVRRLRRDKYDLVYAHEEGAVLAALAAHVFDFRFVYEMHSSLPRQMSTWQFGDLPLIRLAFGWAERHAISRAQAVVATSPALEVIARTIKPDVNVATVVNAYVSDETVSPERMADIRALLAIPGDARVVTYTGSLVPIQQLELLIHAVPIVIAREPRTRVLIVGGSDAEARAMRRSVFEAGLEHVITIAGRRPPEEMPAFMAISHVLVSPRSKGVNAPGKLLSYMSSGRPIVATDAPVHREILSSETAILTEASPAAFAGGILTALGNPHLVEQLTGRARARARELAEPTARTALYERLFGNMPHDDRGPATPRRRSRGSRK
jgi:glycosyltransferase involved in cell wall biosynthesis